MAQGGDGKWRIMVDDGLFQHQKAIGSIYRVELAQGLREPGYGIEKTRPDGRFAIAGVSREAIEAFSKLRSREGLKNSIAPYLKRFELREINGLP